MYITFSRTTASACLWDFGEDELVEPMLNCTKDELHRIQDFALVYNDKNFALPVTGQTISGGHCIALAAITHFEGALRPMVRNRRRPQRDKPDRLTVTDNDSGDAVHDR